MTFYSMHSLILNKDKCAAVKINTKDKSNKNSYKKYEIR